MIVTVPQCKGKLFRIEKDVDMILHYSSNYNLLELNNSHIPVLSPESMIKITFDIILMFVLILNIFYLPLKLAFELKEDLIRFYGLSIGILILDIFLNFNTAFYD
jgi:hypothetical protein